jgi:hypothetical protein
VSLATNVMRNAVAAVLFTGKLKISGNLAGNEQRFIPRIRGHKVAGKGSKKQGSNRNAF